MGLKGKGGRRERARKKVKNGGREEGKIKENDR